MNKFIEKLKKKRTEKEISEILHLIPGSVSYTLVEKKIDNEHFRQGVKLCDGKYKGIIFTTSPKIGLIPQDDGTVKLQYSYQVEYIPPDFKEEVNYFEMEKIVGDVIMDIINKDYSK